MANSGKPFAKSARAVDRVDHPDPLPVQARPVVGPLLRKPAVIGKRAGEVLVEQAIDLEVRCGDNLTRTLEPMRATRTEMAQRKVARRCHGAAQAAPLGRVFCGPHCPATVMPSIRSVGASMP